MLEREPTDRQWEAIRATDQHVLVGAGAGTGKTTTVIGRILYLLGVPVRGQTCPTPLRLQDIAAVTFTNAAAADLKAKLRAALLKAGLREQAYEVDTARIGTIHGFCVDLLREFALRSGRGMLSKVLEEAEGVSFRAEGARQALLAALATAPEQLQPLLSQWELRDVEHWITTLASDSDRLRTLQRRADGLPDEERRLLELAAEARARVEALLEAEGAADFDALIVWTRDLLRDQPAVRRALQRRLRLLVVDEFQDTDPAQREIAYLIGEPERQAPDTPRLLLVGDPKQSIYRFRRADVTVWRAVEDDFRARSLGRVIVLDENFRSVAALLGFVDHTIGRILDTPIDGEFTAVETPFAPLKPALDEPTITHAVELLVVPPDEEAKSDGADVRRDKEAALLARRLAELHRGPEQVPLREIAVLLASWSDAARYEAALRAEGLRTYSLRSEGFFQCRAVMDLILALEVLRDPADERALLGWLRSPWVGLSDESLIRLARGLETPRYTALGMFALSDAEEQARLARAAGLLAEFLPIRDRIPVSDLVDRLLQRTGYLGHLLLLGETGLQRAANVRKFLRMARDESEQSVTGFLRMLTDLEAAGVREGDERLFDRTEDVVTITTIHSAKGLEWRVVAWADLERMPKNSEDTLLLGRDVIGLRRPGLEKDEQPEHVQRLVRQLEHEALAERKRLWYVAATRAKERLLLSGFSKLMPGNGKDTATELLKLLPGLELAEGAPVEFTSHTGVIHRGVVRLTTGPLPPAPPAAPPTERIPAAPAAIPVPVGRRRRSATELRQAERCGRRHHFKYVLGLREPEGSGGFGQGAIERGLIIHSVLEVLEDIEDLEQVLEDAIRHWDPDAPGIETRAGARYRAALADEVKRVKDTSPYRELVAHPEARRELRFLHVTPEGWYVEGAMDLAAPEGDGLALLDVKTTNCAPDAVDVHAEEYAVQRSAYVMAAEAVAGRAVGRFVFQFSRAGRPSETRVDDALRVAAKLQVGRLVQLTGSGAATLTTRPDDCQGCGYRTAGWCEGVSAPGTTAAPAPAPPPSS
jgi:ATP-dependent helicase/nuclease subunit A